MSNAVPFIMKDEALTVMLASGPVTVLRSDSIFNEMVDAIKSKDWLEVHRLADRVGKVKSFVKGDLEVQGNSVLYNGEEVHGYIVGRILEFIEEGLDAEPLLNFLRKLMDNPSKRCVDSLFEFLEHGNMPIDPDGDFYAYKAVKSDWTDKHSGKISNQVGEIVNIPRNKVDDNPDNDCSHGLHAGSIEYVEGFARDSDKMVIVKISPADVVSVPTSDTNKLRCCEYSVVSVYKEPLPDHVYDYDDDGDDDLGQPFKPVYKQG